MLSPNTLLQNRYLIKRAIAKGGMGMVYEAEAVHLGRAIVAVKETFFDEAWLREQFQREASVLARLRHPALPKVTDHFSEGVGQFLVMEFIEGDDLEKLLTKRGVPFEWWQVVEWAERLLDALDYIHTQYPPVIHRDIKPANLKLTPRGELMLLDFGLAKNATTPSRPGGSVHAYTPGFAPPEQIKGTGTDVRCDIYSLGATLYNLLTNDAPADAKLRAEMMAVPMPDPLKPAHLVNSQIPMPVAVVLARAMAVDRERRYTSAAEMREALKQARQSIEETLLDENHRKQKETEAARLLVKQQRLAEEARLRATAESDRIQREETVRKQKEEAQRKQSEETARKLREEAERKQKEGDDRNLREARERELAEHQRRDEEIRKRNQPVSVPLPLSKSRKRLAILGSAVLLTVLLGYWLLNASRSSDGQSQLVAKPTALPAAIPIQPATLSERVEALRYKQKYAADGSFRLHFTAQQKGYLYLVALDDQNIPITLLTNRHAYEVTVSSNRLTAGTEFIFPPKTPLTLSGNQQTAPVTLIFSPLELKEPGFLNAAKLRELTAAEKSALDKMKRRLADRSPQTTPVLDGETVTALPADDKPLVVEIMIRKSAKPAKGS